MFSATGKKHRTEITLKKSSDSVSVTAEQGEHNSRVRDQGALTVFKHSVLNAQMHKDVVKATGWLISVPIFVRDSGQKLLRLPGNKGSNDNPAPCRNHTCASLWSSFKMKLRSFLSFLPCPPHWLRSRSCLYVFRDRNSLVIGHKNNQNNNEGAKAVPIFLDTTMFPLLFSLWTHT